MCSHNYRLLYLKSEENYKIFYRRRGLQELRTAKVSYLAAAALGNKREARNVDICNELSLDKSTTGKAKCTSACRKLEEFQGSFLTVLLPLRLSRENILRNAQQFSELFVR